MASINFKDKVVVHTEMMVQPKAEGRLKVRPNHVLFKNKAQ